MRMPAVGFDLKKGAMMALLLLAAIAVYTIVSGFGGITSSKATFSQSHHGTISGTLGGVYCTPSGGAGTDNLDIAFPNPMLPGVAQTVTSQCAVNADSANADIYVVFNNKTALSALNNLGTYGVANVSGGPCSSPGDSNTCSKNDLFDSSNLNDNGTSCPVGAGPPPVCAPLPNVLRLAQNIAPGQSARFWFSFNYASKLSTEPTEGSSTPWNSYPVPGQVTSDPSHDGSGSGLPYELVAVQAGGPAPTG